MVIAIYLDTCLCKLTVFHNIQTAKKGELRMRLLLASVLVVGVFFSTSYADNAAFQQHLSGGMASFEAGDFKAAEQAFSFALKEKPDSHEATLYLGLALGSLGRDKESASYLKRALMLDPLDPMTNFALAIYYYDNGVLLEAQDFFENTIELAPEGEHAERARKYVNIIARKRTKPWSLNVSTGVQYDSNVVLVSDAGNVPSGISRQSDWRGVAILSAGYKFSGIEKLMLRADYQYYQSLHRGLSSFNVAMHRGSLSGYYPLAGNLILGIKYAFDYVNVGGLRYSYSHTVSPVLTLIYGKGMSTRLEYAYKRTNFVNSASYVSNSERDGPSHRVGLTQSIKLGEKAEAKAGFFYEDTGANVDYHEYRATTFLADLTLKLPREVTATLHLDTYKKTYNGNNPVSGGEREDTRNTFSLSFVKKLNKMLGLTLSQAFIRNDSNISSFDYSRRISTVMLSARF